MKIQYRHQKFQADAAKAVCDVFAGQPYLTQAYMIDMGIGGTLGVKGSAADISTGWCNQKLVPELTDERVLENIRRIQRAQQLAPSDKLEGKYNLTIEMETGVGKTYTYIKTMYELNKLYGWSKFIVVVPSVAIREGVFKSFAMTEEHFAEEYGKKIRYFIYNSARLTEIDRFASDSSINVMIINSQAFNARGKDARRIDMRLDEFRSRRPIDVIAKTNPILIIDEPQSVEGKQTKENLRKFNALFTLRYSATHRADSIYNMIYRLDAMEAYNKHLVKKIAVKGITESGTTATDSYVYLERINLSGSAPTATIQFDCRSKTGTRLVTRTVSAGYNLYDNSGELEEYRNGFILKPIDARQDAIEFVNGVRVSVGDVVGKVSEEQLRRIQIRETILSHLERELELFFKGIKVLSLFFIDEVANYRQYDESGKPVNGLYARIFEEEYNDILSGYQTSIGGGEYERYLFSIPAEKTHAGYFSVDKKGKMTDSKLSDKKERTTDDVSAYDLIMKDKELLLDRDPKRSPVRFIFSHSALREGWDNPNVFQICTLKQSGSDVRKRQEVGRGLRLCVDQNGERMDANVLGRDVHSVNILTVIASESYDSFTRGLQTELAEAVASRPRAVTKELFEGRVIHDASGAETVIDTDIAEAIVYELTVSRYIDRKGMLTDKYFDDKADGNVILPDEVKECSADVLDIIDSVYNEKAFEMINARSNNIEAHVIEDRESMPEFKALWKHISAKTFYVVDFDSDELVEKAIAALDSKLRVSEIYFRVESGHIEKIGSKEELTAGESFVKDKIKSSGKGAAIRASRSVKYDLIGKIVEETGLTRKDVVRILTGIRPDTFMLFRRNPEEFIMRAAALINDEKATVIVQHITYDILDRRYDTSIFTEPTIKGRLGTNAMAASKHLYDYIVYDSSGERKFAEKLDTTAEVAVYVKLPNSFYISTPVGHYNPDWAIAFYKDTVKHIFFVAETKGSMRSMELRGIEDAKIACAREHFRAISSDSVMYEVVDSYEKLLEMVRE